MSASGLTPTPSTRPPNGIIHDASDLNIVYGIIDLLPPDTRGTRHINQERIQAAKELYRKTLRICQKPALRIRKKGA